VCEWILQAILTAEHQVSFFKCGKECTNLMLLSMYVFSFAMIVTFIVMVYNRNMCGIWVIQFIVFLTVNIPFISATVTENNSYVIQNGQRC